MIEQKRPIKLRTAVLVHAADPRAVREWIVLNTRRELWGLRNGPELDRWIELDLAFTNEWLLKLRHGEFAAEGVKPGEVEPTRPDAAWWDRSVQLDLWTGEAEWNGVRLCGLMICPASPKRFGAKENKQRIRSHVTSTPSAAREWMQERVKTWPDDEPPPSEEMDLAAARTHFDANFTRDELRIVRSDRKITPSTWRKPGRRMRRKSESGS